MAKRSEDGIEYFPINTDIIHNPKIKLVVAEFGPKAWAVLLPLYCKIYREKGYWIDWFDEDSKLLFAQDYCKVEKQFVNELVTGCIRRSLFNKRVFEMFGVLTSDRIQENYLTAKKRNKSVNFIEQFSVISDNVLSSFQNVNIIDLNVNIIRKNVNILPQKEKEKKKEIIEGEGEIVYPFLSSDFKNLWENWKVYRKKEFRKNYKTAQSEQAALKNVCNLSGGVEEIAKQIIIQSIANQWQGLFELKINNYGKSNNGFTEKSTGKVTGQQLDKATSKFYQNEQPVGAD